MNASRAVAGGLALAATGYGLAVVAVPGVTTTTETPLYLLTGIGLLALAAGVARLLDGLESSPETLVLPEPELRETAIPGAEFDRAVTERSPSVRERLCEAAVRVLDASPTVEGDVDDLLATGEWTDDERAAAFFAEESEIESPSVDDVRHVVAALDRVAGGDGERPELPDSEHSGWEARLLAALPGSPATVEAEPASVPPTGETTVRATGRWRGLDSVGLLAVAVGALFREPAALLVGAVGIAVAAYVRVDRAPELSLDVRRTLDNPDPEPDESVEVTVTVRNGGDTLLPDLRLVAAPPPGLVVTDGSPRLATALAAGAATEFSYTVRAARGDHEFRPLVAAARNASGSVERLGRVPALAETTISCRPPLVAGESLPLRAQTTQYVGRIETETGGQGVEFFGTRGYRPGDPLSRIDWARWAKTGTMATLEFREERSPTVFLAVDARAAACLAPTPDAPSAVEQGVAAAGTALATLLDAGDQVGLTALSPHECWLPSGAGADHRTRAEHLLATHPAFEPAVPDEPFLPVVQRHRLRRRLPGAAQLVLLAPLCDGYVLSLVGELEAVGHPTTVVSPDVTGGRTPGARLAALERDARIGTLRRRGTPVVDWDPDESLTLALARHGGRSA